MAIAPPFIGLMNALRTVNIQQSLQHDNGFYVFVVHMYSKMLSKKLNATGNIRKSLIQPVLYDRSITFSNSNNIREVSPVRMLLTHTCVHGKMMSNALISSTPIKRDIPIFLIEMSNFRILGFLTIWRCSTRFCRRMNEYGNETITNMNNTIYLLK